MNPNQTIDLNLAIFLGECCIQTYVQYENDGKFDIPEGYELVDGFKATSIDVEEWFGFIIKSPEKIILAFRGSHSHLDWIADAEVAQVNYPFINNAGKTHRGFTGIYSSCRDHLVSVLKNLPPSIPLYVTGHSLGAALALLAILDITVNTHFKHAVMYNFAGPRVGNLRFTFTVDAKVEDSFRIVNIYDIVPKYPPIVVFALLRDKWWLYRHALREFPISVQTGTIIGNHDIRTYVDALKLLDVSHQ
ncbi:MAG: lipase family protein [Desulfitobacteriaceae bacterium]